MEPAKEDERIGAGRCCLVAPLEWKGFRAERLSEPSSVGPRVPRLGAVNDGGAHACSFQMRCSLWNASRCLAINRRASSHGISSESARNTAPWNCLAASSVSQGPRYPRAMSWAKIVSCSWIGLVMNIVR